MVAGPHVVVALFAIEDCHAAYFLEEEGVERLALMQDISEHPHGEEDEDFCASFETPYMKALRVKDGRDALKSAKSYRSADRILLDTFVESVPGGTGKTMDWTQAALVVLGCDKPVVLAGGLDGDNVGEAIRTAAPAGVDVSSGVEESPGIKNVDKLKSFFDGVYSV